ncbi:MAG: OsmC family protein [Pseudonocardia sp.]|nr:OsmC family protein [Pseudonocardia sp.]
MSTPDTDTRPSHRTDPGGTARPAAHVDAPRGAARGHALFAHCLTRDPDDRSTDDGRTSGAAGEIARTLTGRGIGVLRVDLTGSGGSVGPGFCPTGPASWPLGPAPLSTSDAADTPFSGAVEALVRAADRMRDDGRAPELLIGHGLGGAAVLAAAARIPEVAAVATIGAAPVPGVRLAASTVPLMVLHAPDDEIVGFDQAGRVATAAGPRASVVALDGADHLLGRAADACWAAALIESWASRFLPAALDGPAAGDRPEPGTVVVSAGGVRPYGQDVDTDLLHWSADEPVSAGGAGSGPDPYQLLLSSLGACTAITLRMYADRAGLPLDDATVTLTHDRLHATDCAECETSKGHVDRIVREIHLEGDLDATQRAKLLAIADRCPVHRTLTSEIVIETDEV